MITKPDISRALSSLNPDLVSEIMVSGSTQDIPKNTEILREGQYVKVVPVVLKGLIRVFTSYEG